VVEQGAVDCGETGIGRNRISNLSARRDGFFVRTSGLVFLLKESPALGIRSKELCHACLSIIASPTARTLPDVGNRRSKSALSVAQFTKGYAGVLTSNTNEKAPAAVRPVTKWNRVKKVPSLQQLARLQNTQRALFWGWR
jgi:hypothetical protein